MSILGFGRYLKGRNKKRFLVVVAIIAIGFSIFLILEWRFRIDRLITTDYYENSYAIVYGKVKNVENRYWPQRKDDNILLGGESLIESNIEIEVIEDYKNSIEKGEIITVENNGREVIYDELTPKSGDTIRLKKEYENQENKAEIFTEFVSNDSYYRVGEDVLVYLSYYTEYGDTSEVHNYNAFIKQYVDPNTEEVYRYVYKNLSENEQINVRENITTLDDLRNKYKE